MSNYPVLILLKNKTKVNIRPIEDTDLPGVKELWKHIPADEKIIYRDDVSRTDAIESWFLNSGYRKNVHLIAETDKRIIAEGTLHSEGLYWQHSAEIKLIIHPEYRNLGIARKLFSTLIYEGLRNRFQKIIVRYRDDSRGFKKILQQFEFRAETSLRYYVEDESSKKRKDLIIASFDLANWSHRFDYYKVIFNL